MHAVDGLNVQVRARLPYYVGSHAGVAEWQTQRTLNCGFEPVARANWGLLAENGVFLESLARDQSEAPGSR